jgi:hypothetical protein
MPRSCSICTNKRCAEIESEMVAGQPLGQRFRLTCLQWVSASCI